MTIPFRVKKLTKTAKAPHSNCESDLWDLYADDFCVKYSKHKPENKFFKELLTYEAKGVYKLRKNDRVLIKTGISLELPALYHDDYIDCDGQPKTSWAFKDELKNHSGIILSKGVYAYAVADIRPRSDNLEQKGLFIENKIITGGEVSFVAINHGHEPITISKGDVIAKMLIRPLYPSKMEIVEDIEDTGRGGYGSTGK